MHPDVPAMSALFVLIRRAFAAPFWYPDVSAGPHRVFLVALVRFAGSRVGG